MNAREDGGVRDLVAVEVKDGQDGAVADGVEEFVGVPGGGERAGLGFAVADAAGDDEVGVVEGRAEGVRERVAELAAFVDGAGSFGRAVAADAAGEGEVAEEREHALGILTALGVDLGVVAFEIAVGERGGRAVAGAGDVDDVEVEYFLMRRLRWTQMKDWPGSEPQWPSRRFLMCSGLSGSRSSGLSRR